VVSEWGTTLNCAKTAKPIRVPFVVLTYPPWKVALLMRTCTSLLEGISTACCAVHSIGSFIHKYWPDSPTAAAPLLWTGWSLTVHFFD